MCIRDRAKSARQKEALSAPKVGSACVVEADDWLAAAAANQAVRERTGATGNAFASAESLVKEAKRQAVDDDDEFAIEPKRARVDEEDADEPPAAAAVAAAAPAEAGPSRDAKREIELSVLELRDELEEEGLDEDDIDAQCDTLREALLYKARKG